jgi:hypothetical protein
MQTLKSLGEGVSALINKQVHNLGIQIKGDILQVI